MDSTSTVRANTVRCTGMAVRGGGQARNLLLLTAITARWCMMYQVCTKVPYRDFWDPGIPVGDSRQDDELLTTSTAPLALMNYGITPPMGFRTHVKWWNGQFCNIDRFGILDFDPFYLLFIIWCEKMCVTNISCDRSEVVKATNIDNR